MNATLRRIMTGKSYDKKVKALFVKIKDLMEQEKSCEIKIRIVKGNLSNKISVVKIEYLE